MDINGYLKDYLNKDGHIKNKNLEELITQLESIISTKLQDMKINRRDNIKKILHDSLMELGWSREQISKLSKPKSIGKGQDTRRVSPSFKYYKNKTEQPKTYTKPYQGGSPGLGKGKS
tara:strand:+ start:367 stop:720 length:354 start_codon:yes stop_codon:yes gene_type:complete